MNATTTQPQGTLGAGEAPGGGVPSPAVATLRPIGPHLVMAPQEAEDDSLWAALGRLRAVPDALILLVAAVNAAPMLRQQLPELARIARARGAGTIVLAASGLAGAAPGGTRPAEHVAGVVGLSVIAPDGMVSVQPDGTLEVTSIGPDWGPPSWWRCTATGPAEPLGSTWPPPEPAAQPDLPALGSAPGLAPGPSPSPELVVTALRSGLWIRSAAAEADPTLSERLGSVSAGPGTCVFVLGHPSCPEVSLSGPAIAARTHAQASDELVLSAPWASPERLVALAAGLAQELDRDVRAVVGVPMRTGSGDSAMVLGPDGSPAWEPYLTELTALPKRGRVVASAWRHRENGWTPMAPAVFGVRALPGRLLEAIPAGLWLRTDGPPADPATRLLPPDPVRPLLVLGEPGLPLAPDVFEQLGELLEGLPSGNRPGLLVNVPLSTEEEAIARFVARTHRLHWVERAGDDILALVTAPTSGPGSGSEVPEPALPASEVPKFVQPPAWPEPVTDPAPVATTTSGIAYSALVPATPVVPADTRVPPDIAEAMEPGELPGEEPGEAATIPLSPITFATDGSPVRPGASTPADREQLRVMLGPAFVRLVNRADQIATRLPGLRSTPIDDIKADLVAVLLHHTDTGVPATRAELVAAARSDRASHLSAYLTCLTSGLRRLPSHHGAVLLGAIAGERELQQYTAGSLLIEPAPVAALPAHDVDLGTPVEFAVWSTTGRRTALFGNPGDEPVVVFPPGTRFRVLNVRPGSGPGTPSRVLLREIGAVTEEDRVSDGVSDREQSIQDRLFTWLERRDQLPAQERREIDRPERFHLTPGVTLG